MTHVSVILMSNTHEVSVLLHIELTEGKLVIMWLLSNINASHKEKEDMSLCRKHVSMFERTM